MRDNYRIIAAAAALAACFGGAAGVAAAQEPTVEISGTVRTAEGRPVGGATVVARGDVERRAVTDGAGAYRLGALPAGAYVLRVDAIGYGSVTREVEASGPDIVVDLVVEAAPITLSSLEVVAATRSGSGAASLPIKVDVIDEREIQLQRSVASTPTEVLSNVIPSFAPSRQKLTSAGESFRGRRPLFLIDGVPQSNPLRDGRRDGFTIDVEAIERVEVIFGANAIQGLGATGGIVNYVTVSPSATGELEQRISVTTTVNDRLDGDGFGWRAHYLAAKRVGSFDLLGSVSYERRDLQFDGRGRPIGIDAVQGDVADSHSRNFFGKIGWRPTADQRLELMVNDFRLAQEGDFDVVAGDRTLGVPAISIAGDPAGIEPINDVTTVSIGYENGAVAGGTLSLEGYVQDFSALYGGDTNQTFQDPLIAPVGELFDQSQNNSEKYGARLTYARRGVAGGPIDGVTGFDFIRDKTFQRLVHTDRNWVPETEFFNYAPFLQLDVEPIDRLTISGGIRWELAQLNVADFTTVAGNREDYQRVQVSGGSPGFDEPLFNIGGVVTPIDGLRFYGTLSQAFTMPDVGRVLRGITEEGTAVEEFLALQPIKTENLEFGGTFSTAWSSIGVTYFESSADAGSRLVPNADGIFQVLRQPTKTSGWEITGRVVPVPSLTFAAGYSLLEGRFDGDDDGELEADLGAADIGPDRLNLSMDVARGRFSGRLQAFTYFDRTFRDGAGAAAARFDGYTTVDGSLSAAVGFSTITFSVSNLLDEQYITYYGQAATDRADRFFAGRGRTFTLRAEARL